MGFGDQANEQLRGSSGAATAIMPTGSSGANNLVSLFVGSDGLTAKKEQRKEEGVKARSAVAGMINYGFSQGFFHAWTVVL